jgi:abhydrolase domain-containing protein 12
MLYAWLVVPLGLYSRHEKEFSIENSMLFGDVKTKIGFRLLASDPESRLVIYCKPLSPL